MKSWSVPAWNAAAILAVIVVLLGIGLGRPDADRFRLAEVADPTCSTQGALLKQFAASDLVLTGTASTVTDSYVEITPDHFYFGAPSWAPLTVRIDRRGWDFPWSQGERYVIASFHSQLNECGATQPYSGSAAKALAEQYN